MTAQNPTNPLSSDSSRKSDMLYGKRLFGKPAFSRNILRDMRFVAKTGLSDAVWVYTSPTRSQPKALKYLAGVVAVGAGIYFLDDEISAGCIETKIIGSLNPFMKLASFWSRSEGKGQ
ncbi:MAG: hypothetical protein IPP40_04905 [bacterium]|nr:hypothetical protein [bacterium]